MQYAFKELLEKASMEVGQDGSHENITKELLHYDILRAFSDSDIARHVTLQGGSALRLFYGGQRYSEDLDFVIGAGDDKQIVLDEVNDVLKSLIMDRYGLHLEIKEPKSNEFGSDINVRKWEYKIQIPGFDQKQRIKVEFCNVPSHDPKAMTLSPRYSFLGDQYASIMLRVESKREILADKVKAIVNREYLKGRDLWDLKTLSDQGVSVDFDLVRQKFADYRNTGVPDDLKRTQDRLKSPDAAQTFMNEMERFLSRKALKGLYLTDPPGIEFIRFAIEQLEVVQRELFPDPSVTQQYGSIELSR